jgi:O-acetyl-ADP-ribose deacetylase (regulator of RNase III)/ADP-ribose pyrophosphatase YjhB (NUDIX family)
MKIKNTEIKIVMGDITELKVDAIVNAANNKLVMGAGLAGMIRKKGGQGIEEEAIKKGPIDIGQAAFTGAGKLPAKYIIHTATMGMDFVTDEIKIRNAAGSALKLSEELKINSLALPALGCGVGGFSLSAAAKIMAQEVFKHLTENKTSLQEIIFCLYDQKAYDAFAKNALGYLDYIVNQLRSPFVTVDAIIELEGGIVIIKRKNPPFGWALPGGFLDYGESLEHAAIREAKEETSLEISEVVQLHTYSDPKRDPRFHTIGTVFIARGKGKPCAADDAADLKIIRFEDLDKIDFAFDHKKIIRDYFAFKKKPALP